MKENDSDSLESRGPDVDGGDDCEWLVQLLAQIQMPLHRFIMTLLPQASDADEVFQETILVLWRKRSEFERGSNFMAWACVIARYEVFRYLRTHRRDKIGLSESAMTKLAEIAEARAISLDLDSARREALSGCIKKLRSEEREVIRLRYYLNEAVEEIAEKLGKAQSTVYAALTRARGHLAECVQRQMKRT